MQQVQQKTPFFESDRWHHFVQSNYVTWFTEWLMTFASKCVEVVLYATVLYSCAELYPGVNMPAGLTLAVFLLQMGALDVGGIGLSKMARQARKDDNKEGAHIAETMSKWLIGIMIISLVTASLGLTISHIPAVQSSKAAQQGLDLVETIISLVLVVARAVCAVLYGKVIHSLKVDAPARVSMPTKQADLEKLIGDAVVPMFQQLQQLAETVQLFSVCFESKLKEIETSVRVSVENNIAEFQQLQLKTQQQFHLSFSERLEGLNETLQLQEKALVLSPDVTEQIGQIETEVTRVKMLVERVISQRPTVQAPAASHRTASPRVVVSEASETRPFDRKQFVFDCLTENSEMKLVEMQTRAEKLGYTLSLGAASSYRNAFVESRNASIPVSV